MFLLGEFQNRIDPRGRAFVPAKFRDSLGSPVYMVIDGRKCIECYNEEGIRKKYESAAEKYRLLNPETVENIIFANADTQNVDNQGRIILKPSFLELLGADKDVVFLGRGEYFEIWAKDEYDRMRLSANSRGDTAKELSALEEKVRLLEMKKELLDRMKALEEEIGEI